MTFLRWFFGSRPLIPQSEARRRLSVLMQDMTPPRYRWAKADARYDAREVA